MSLELNKEKTKQGDFFLGKTDLQDLIYTSHAKMPYVVHMNKEDLFLNFSGSLDDIGENLKGVFWMNSCRIRSLQAMESIHEKFGELCDVHLLVDIYQLKAVQNTKLSLHFALSLEPKNVLKSTKLGEKGTLQFHDGKYYLDHGSYINPDESLIGQRIEKAVFNRSQIPTSSNIYDIISLMKLSQQFSHEAITDYIHNHVDKLTADNTLAEQEKNAYMFTSPPDILIGKLSSKR